MADQHRALLRFGSGRVSIAHAQYFPGWPARIQAHGLEGASYFEAPTKKSFIRVADEVIGPPLPSDWHGQIWPVYVEEAPTGSNDTTRGEP